MVVYIITNLINDKKYIGQTIGSIGKRWKRHCYDNSRCFAVKSAIDKYGAENFKIEELYNATSREELNIKEEEFINKFNTLSPNGYNLKTGGNGPIYSEESRKKMSISHKGRKPSKESIRKGALSRTGANNWAFGKKFSEEHKKNLSIAHKGKIGSHVGHKHSKETRNKISIATTGKIPWNKGVPMSEKQKVILNIKRKKIKIICHQNKKIYLSMRDAEKDLNLVKGSVRWAIVGRNKNANGYTFSKVL